MRCIQNLEFQAVSTRTMVKRVYRISGSRFYWSNAPDTPLLSIEPNNDSPGVW
jgi:hypothetical protein